MPGRGMDGYLTKPIRRRNSTRSWKLYVTSRISATNTPEVVDLRK